MYTLSIYTIINIQEILISTMKKNYDSKIYNNVLPMAFIEFVCLITLVQDNTQVALHRLMFSVHRLMLSVH